MLVSLNFEGLGFGFSARDEGLLTYQKQVLTGFDKITDQTERMNKVASRKTLVGAGSGGPGGGGGPGGPGDGGGVMAMPEPPDPSKHISAWGKLGAAASKAFTGIFSSSKRANKELSGMADVGHKLRSILGQLRLGNFLQSLNLSNLNEITDAMDKLGGAGRNLTTSVEGSFQAMGKTATATFTNLGFGTKEIKKYSSQASSMARGMGEDVGSTTKAIAAYAKYTSQYAAIGVHSAQDLVKAETGLGVDTLQFGNTLGELTTAYGLNNEQLSQLTQSSVAFGRQSMDVNGAITNLNPLMDKLSLTTDRYGNTLKGADLAKFAGQTLSLASGFSKMGYTADKAMGAAETFADVLAKGRKDYSSLFIQGGEMPKFLTELSIGVGDFQDSFALMQKGPAGFAKGMLDMVKQVKAKGGNVEQFVNTIGVRMEEELGPDKAAMLKNFMLTADDSVLGVIEKTMNAKDSFGLMARTSWKSGITLAQSFEMAEENLVTSFRSISRSSSQTFVKDFRAQSQEFAAQLKGLASGDGPMAEVVKKLSEIHQLGMTALLPKSLRPAAALFGTMAKEIGPMLGILGSLGFRFSMLLSPLTLLAAPLALLAITFGDLVMKTYDAKNKTYDLGKAFGQLGDKVNKFFDEDLAGLWSTFANGVKDAAKWIAVHAPTILRKAFEKAIDFAQWLRNAIAGGGSAEWAIIGKTFMDGIRGLFADGAAGTELGAQLQNLFSEAFVALYGWVSTKLIPGLWATFVSLVIPLTNKLSDLISSVDWNAVGVTVGQGIGKAVHWGIEALKGLFTGETGPLGTAFRGLVSAAWGALTGLAAGLWEGLKNEFGTSGAVMTILAASLFTPFGGMITDALVGSVTKILWPLFIQPFLVAFGAASGASTVVTSVATSFGSMFSKSLGAGSLIKSVSGSMGTMLWTAIRTTAVTLLGWITTFGASLFATSGAVMAAGIVAGVAIYFGAKSLFEYWGFDKKLEQFGVDVAAFFHGEEEIPRGTTRGMGAVADQAKKAAADVKKAVDVKNAALAAPPPESKAIEMPEVSIEAEAQSMGLPGGLGRSKKAIALVRQEADQLPKSFESAYANLTPKTTKFFETYTKGFKDFTKGLNEVWLKGITSMLDAMNAMVVAVQTDASSINSDVQRMTQQLLAVQELHDKTMNMSASAEPVISAAMQTNLDSLPETFKAVAMAVHDPAWYQRYEALFMRKMDALIAVSASKVPAPGGPRDPSQSGIQAGKNRDALAKSGR